MLRTDSTRYQKWKAPAPRAVAMVTAAVLAVGMTALPSAAAPGGATPEDVGTAPEALEDSSNGYPFHDTSLAPTDRVDDLIARMTLDEKVGLLHQFSAAVTRLGIPQFRTGTEGLHGLSWLGYATVFPQASGLGMMWNPELAEEIGDVIGREARAYNSVDARFNGVNVWAPVVDTARDPRYGRISETMSEDAFLAGQLASGLGGGMQGTDDGDYFQAIPMLKHFAAYGQEASRTSYSANASPRNLHEYYFKSFRDPIEAGTVNGMMTGYNLINGKPSMVMPEVSDDMYGEWVPEGKRGAFFAVTDANSPSNLSGNNDNAYYPNSTLGQAASMADSLRNGIASMTPSDTDTPTTRRWIYEALGRGMISEPEIDEAIFGVLLVRLHAGDLDADAANPYKQLNKRNALDTPEHRAVAAQAAREQVVLLKNEGDILPLAKSSDVALVGPLGDESSTDFYAGTFPYVTLINEEMQGKVAGEGSLTFSRGIDTVALKVTNGTGAPADKFVVVADDATATLTGTGTSADDERAHFQLYDYGYNNMLMRSVATDRYVAARGSGNSLVATANPPGFQSANRATQEWFTNQNFGIVAQSGDTVSLRFSKGTAPAGTTQAPNVHVNTSGANNVQHNGNASSANRQFELITVQDGIEEAVAQATAADVAVVAVGDQPHLTSRETFDRSTDGTGINLSSQQEELIEAVADANPNTVVVIVGSYPFDVDEVQDNPNVKGIVHTSHAGQELGSAVADVLFGDYAPAGRLSQTWYSDVTDLPAISDYDIIKGERTYQYFDGDVIYPFGFGLTYSDFEYSGLTLSPPTVANTAIENTSIQANLTVKNTGDTTSDEVVQVYASYDGKDVSRVEHPIRTLVGFERINIAGSSGGMVQETEVSIPVRLADLAIWDVSQNRFFVEPGTYTISAGTSSAEEDQQVIGKLTVTGDPLPARNLGTVTKAYNFDDYSYTDAAADGARQADVIPTAVHEDDTYGITVRKAGAWVKYAEVDFSGSSAGISLRASNSNAAAAELEIWANGPSTADGGTQLGTVEVPPTLHAQTFINVGANLSNLPAGTADLYLVSPSAGVSVSWLRLGPVQPAQSGDVSITANHYNTNLNTSLSRFHVRVPAAVEQTGGHLVMESAVTAPKVVTGPVEWTVTDTDGGATSLATINGQGQLTAAGTADGTVRVLATFPTANGSISGSVDVELRNQTVATNSNPEAVVIRSGWDSRPSDISWGPNQFGSFGSIHQFQGSVQLSAVTYPANVNPARPVTFTVADADGNPTDLAEIVSEGAGFIEGQTSGNNNRAYNATLQATGAGNGDVYVTATTENGLSWTSRVIIQGQEVRDLSAGRYEAELFDGQGNIEGASSNLRADNVHGDDVGMQLNRIRNGDWAVYRNVDLGESPSQTMYMRYLKVSTETARITVMADDPVSGIKLGEVSLTGDLEIGSDDYKNPVYEWRDVQFPVRNVPGGVHDLYLVFEVAAAVPNTDISSTYGAVPGWLDLGINWFGLDLPADTSQLADAVDAATSLDAGQYTTSSWAAADIAAALVAAEAVLAAEAPSAEEITAALEALNAALDLLVERGSTATLQVLIEAGAALEGKLSGFTADSVTAFEVALAGARAELAAADDRSQSQLDAVVATLQEALDGLTVDVQEPVVNKAALQALYDAVRGLSNPDNTYTAASWTALRSAITNAANVLGSASATQQSVDAATSRLSQAVAGLQITDKRPVKLKINQRQVRLVRGKSLRVEEGVYYLDDLKPSYSGQVTWKSSKPKIASVNKNGKIKAKKTGTVTITVTTKERSTTGKKLSAKVKVKVFAKRPKARVTKVSAVVPKRMAVGSVAYVTGKYKKAKATGVKVRYSSSNPEVARIDRAGRLVAVGKGTAQIRVKAGGKSVKYRLTIA